MCFRSGLRTTPAFGSVSLVTTVVLSGLAGPIAGGALRPAQAAGPEMRKSEVVALSAHDLNLLNRITWGASPSSAQEFATLGADKFLDRQLHPAGDGSLPHDAQVQIDALGISHTPMETFVADMDQQAKTANAITDPEQKQTAQKAYQDSLARFGREAGVRSLLRDLYSPYQLREQLTWFWLNHFNVHLYKSNIRLLIADYEDKAIRAHALGRFATFWAPRCAIPPCCVISTTTRTRPGTSTRIMPARSWSCTPWGWAPAIPKTTCRSSPASSPAWA
jgi:hypothetical protein